MTNYKIKTNEAIALITNLLCNKLFVLAPYYLKQASNNAALLMISLFFAVSFVAFRICLKFYSFKKDLLDLSKNKLLRLSIGLILSVTFFIVITLTLRQYSEGTKIMTMHKSPVSFIGGIFGLGMILGAICGTKSIAKSSSIFTPVIFAVAIVLTLFSVRSDSLYGVFPILGEGLNVIIQKGFIMLSMLFEIIVIFLLPTFLAKPEELKEIGNYAFLWSFIIFTIIGGAYCINSPQNFNLESYEPFFTLVKEIEFGKFLQRFDLLFFILYCLSAFLYLSSMLYFLTYILCKTLGINDKKALTAPVGILIICTSFMNNLQEYMFTIIGKVNYVLWIAAFILPFLPIIKFGRNK